MNKIKSISSYDFYLEQQQQPTSASVSAISDTGKYIFFCCFLFFFKFESNIDATTDQCLSSSTLLNKSTSDLLSLAHLSSSQTPLSSSISIPTVSQVNTYFEKQNKS
jgi:hypothetical protein